MKNIWVRKHTLIKYTAFFLLFLAILLFSRWTWLTYFTTVQPVQAVQGEIDLSEWSFAENRPLTLNGEWAFYPNEWVTYEDLQSDDLFTPRYVEVPGDWSDGFEEESDDAFGYGTYRLSIRVSPGMEEPYIFWIRRPQTSSRVEANGQDLGGFGVPSAKQQSYIPKIMSYTSEYEPDGDQTENIELLIHVANYDQPYAGGLTAPVKMGARSAVETERWYSIGLQLATFLIFMLHAAYTVILYFLTRRNHLILIFALIMMLAGLIVVAGHDLIFFMWFPLDYGLSVKIRLLCYPALTCLMLYWTMQFIPPLRWATPIRWFLRVVLLYIVVTLLAPVRVLLFTTEIYFHLFLYLVPLTVTLLLIVRFFIRNEHGALYMLFAATGLLSSVIWGVISTFVEIDAIFYPIDMLAALTCFSAYWFKRYIRNANENVVLNKELQAANRAKDEFLANTSHELRTPLHGIMNLAHAVTETEQYALQNKSLKDLNLLMTISKRMSRMLDDLLDVSQLQDGKIQLNREPLSLNGVVSGVTDMLHYMTEGKPVDLRIEIPSLPAVMADEKRLVQILYNLVHNALKFTQEGTVTIQAEKKGAKVAVTIRDTGQGIEAEELSRIFDRYVQTESGVRDSRGIGLGLGISRQLVGLHGSELTVTSKLGNGSEFRFELPVAEETINTTTVESGEAVMAEPSTFYEQSIDVPLSVDEALSLMPLHEGGERMHILIVDDDSVNLQILSRILSNDGYLITSANSARKALDCMLHHRFDLLIVDVMMPQISGYELSRKVRERFSPAELPILLLTARSQPADIYTGFLAGANDYMSKPADALELRYRVRSLLLLKQSIEDKLSMEAAYLQAQIHPHFLFNTLNAIMALSKMDQAEMERVAEAFISYLHISYNYMNVQEWVPLRHELELVESYLYIEKVRFGERLTVVTKVQVDREVQVPPLTLQPLVENAVRHGLLNKLEGGTLTLRVYEVEDHIRFEVEDDGIGMDPEKIKLLLDLTRTERSGIGLINTHRRLIQRYEQGLNIDSAIGTGTLVFFEIPVH